MESGVQPSRANLEDWTALMVEARLAGEDISERVIDEWRFRATIQGGWKPSLAWFEKSLARVALAAFCGYREFPLAEFYNRATRYIPYLHKVLGFLSPKEALALLKDQKQCVAALLSDYTWVEPRKCSSETKRRQDNLLLLWGRKRLTLKRTPSLEKWLSNDFPIPVMQAPRFEGDLGFSAEFINSQLRIFEESHSEEVGVDKFEKSLCDYLSSALFDEFRGKHKVELRNNDLYLYFMHGPNYRVNTSAAKVLMEVRRFYSKKSVNLMDKDETPFRSDKVWWSFRRAHEVLPEDPEDFMPKVRAIGYKEIVRYLVLEALRKDDITVPIALLTLPNHKLHLVNAKRIVKQEIFHLRKQLGLECSGSYCFEPQSLWQLTR